MKSKIRNIFFLFITLFISVNGIGQNGETATKVNTPIIAETVSVTFNIDMAMPIDNISFIPGSDSIYVTGSFANEINDTLGWDEPGLGESLRLIDDNNDQIYAGTIQIEKNIGSVAYRYFINSGWERPNISGDINLIIGDVDLIIFDYNVFFVKVNEKKLFLVTFYPNPFNEVIVINNATIVSLISIQNALGQTVFEGINRESTLAISTTQLETGIYFITLKDKAGNIRTQKLIKQ